MTPDITPDLQATVERAYHVFAPYQLGADLEVCRCNVCMCDPETERVLVTTPLRALPAPWLAEYTNSAHGYGEGRIAHELRHFLPRYLDLVAHDDPPSHLGLVYCLSRLGQADWRARWPVEEAAAIEAFFAALLADRLGRDAVDLDNCRVGPTLVWDMEEVLLFVVNAGGDLPPLLRVWDAAPDPGASLHAAQLAEQFGECEAVDTPGLVYWEDLADAWTVVVGWLRRPHTRQRLASLLALTRDPAHQAILQRGLDGLDAMDAKGGRNDSDRPARSAEGNETGGGRLS